MRLAQVLQSINETKEEDPMGMSSEQVVSKVSTVVQRIASLIGTTVADATGGEESTGTEDASATSDSTEQTPAETAQVISGNMCRDRDCLRAMERGNRVGHVRHV